MSSLSSQSAEHPGLVRRAVTRIAAVWATATDAWHSFWFRPIDPLMIGFIRLLSGWMLFYNLLIWSVDLEAFFSDNGLQPIASIRALHEGDWVFSFWLWTGDTWLWPMHLGCLAIAGLFCLGVASRITSVLCFLITISYSQRVPIANFGFDQILGFLCLYLSLAPSGACLSVDSLIRKWWRRRKGLSTEIRRSSAAQMASRLIQLHLCAIYLWAGFSKLKGPSWWTGEAMWRVIANQEYQTIDLTWMANVPWLPYLIAHITIAWEISFTILVWNPQWRPLVLFVGLLMHLGIGAFLGMWTFGLIMAFGYFAFSDADRWRSRLTRFTSSLWRRKAVSSDEEPELLGCDPAWNPLKRPEENCESEAATETVGTGETRRRQNIAVGFLECDARQEPHDEPVEVHAASESSLEQSEAISAAVDSGDKRCQHPPAVFDRPVCIVTFKDQDRAALRRHFRSHGQPCLAVTSLNDGLILLSRQKFSAVVVHGRGQTMAAIIDFVEDVLDLTGLPVVILLKHQQATVADRFCHLSEVSCVFLPASLKEIRQHVESRLLESRPLLHSVVPSGTSQPNSCESTIPESTMPESAIAESHLSILPSE